MSDVIPFPQPHALICWRCKSTAPVEVYALSAVDRETFVPESMVGDHSVQLCGSCTHVLELARCALVDAMTEGKDS